MTIKGFFRIDVFDCTVFLHVSDNIKRVINYQFKKHNREDESLENDVSGYFVNFRVPKIGEYHIFLDYSDLAVDVINHEKSHLIDHVLQDRDIKLDDEVRAYLDGYISHKIDEFLKKKRLKVKNKR
jgi:hypothetical protein